MHQSWGSCPEFDPRSILLMMRGRITKHTSLGKLDHIWTSSKYLGIPFLRGALQAICKLVPRKLASCIVRVCNPCRLMNNQKKWKGFLHPIHLIRSNLRSRLTKMRSMMSCSVNYSIIWQYLFCTSWAIDLVQCLESCPVLLVLEDWKLFQIGSLACYWMIKWEWSPDERFLFMAGLSSFRSSWSRDVGVAIAGVSVSPQVEPKLKSLPLWNFSYVSETKYRLISSLQVNHLKKEVCSCDARWIQLEWIKRRERWSSKSLLGKDAEYLLLNKSSGERWSRHRQSCCFPQRNGKNMPSSLY